MKDFIETVKYLWELLFHTKGLEAWRYMILTCFGLLIVWLIFFIRYCMM